MKIETNATHFPYRLLLRFIFAIAVVINVLVFAKLAGLGKCSNPFASCPNKEAKNPTIQIQSPDLVWGIARSVKDFVSDKF